MNVLSKNRVRPYMGAELLTMCAFFSQACSGLDGDTTHTALFEMNIGQGSAMKFCFVEKSFSEPWEEGIHFNGVIAISSAFRNY